MSYRMSERDYVSLATYMSVKLSLQFVIRLGALGTHDTKLLHVVEAVPEYIYFSLVCSNFNSLNCFCTEVLICGTHRLSFELFVQSLIFSD